MSNRRTACVLPTRGSTPRALAARALAVRALLMTLVVAVATTLAAASTVPANAIDDGRTAFEPAGDSMTSPRPFFTFNLRAGARLKDRVVLTNKSTERTTYDIYAADATTVDGTFAIASRDAVPKDVGTWLHLPVRKVVLDPKESRSVPVRIRVPRDVTSGDHAGGIVALPRTTQDAQAKGNVRLKARYGVGVRVYLRIEGPVSPGLTITDLSLETDGGLGALFLGPGSARVDYTVVNSGNVRLVPDSNVVVSTRTGGTPVDPRTLGEMLPGSTSTTTEEVGGLSPGSMLGFVEVEVTVTAPGSDPVTATMSVWTVPWLSLGTLVLLGVAAWWLLRRARRRRTSVPDQPSGEPRVLEAVES